MVTINCSVYEKHDLLEVLEYAKKKKIQDYESGKITKELMKFDTNIIDKLIQRVNGKYVEDYFKTSLKYSPETLKSKRGLSLEDDLKDIL